MKAYKKLAYVIWGILLSLVLLLTSVEFVAFNINNYKKSFVKYEITRVTKMDQENLEATIKDLLKYLKDNREELDTRAVINGEERQVFGSREIQHMVDVKDLFIKGRNIRNISLLLFIIIGLIIAKKDKYWKTAISNTLIYTSIINILFLIVLLLLIKIDFNKYFTYFHLIFFNNDLWLLDPNTEVLIQMLPEGFFYTTAVKILAYFVSSLVALGLLGYGLVKKEG